MNVAKPASTINIQATTVTNIDRVAGDSRFSEFIFSPMARTLAPFQPRRQTVMGSFCSRRLQGGCSSCAPHLHSISFGSITLSTTSTKSPRRIASYNFMVVFASTLLRPGDLRGVTGTGRRGTGEEAGPLGNAECGTVVGVSGKWEMTAVTAPFLPQPPHDWAINRFVDSVRRSPLRAKGRLDPFFHVVKLQIFFHNHACDPDSRQKRKLRFPFPMETHRVVEGH